MQRASLASLLLGLALAGCGGSGGSGGGGTPTADTTPRLHDLYVFRSPANANNVVVILTFDARDPATGEDGPTAFSADQTFFVHVDVDADLASDFDFAATFTPPGGGGTQDVTLRLNGALVAQGVVGTNVPIPGGQLRAGPQDDPAFADHVGLDAFLDGGAFPRPPGTAANFYGPTRNCHAIVLEFPAANLQTSGDIFRFWATSEVGGVQVDRVGRPHVLDLLIPPVPRGPVHGFTPDRRPEFRALADPALDEFFFRSDAISILTGFWTRTSIDAGTLEGFFLPDVLPWQVGNPNGFGTLVGPGGTILGNGRRLSDDVTDTMLNVLSNGTIPTDNVGDDNGLGQTDGSVDPVRGTTRPIAFPYLGAPH